ncbi:MAG TPA: (Fe-S)-binding protein [Sulfuricurvum sp.]|nr:MAG: glycerol-3-phosphate dehydrogenase [Campylobacterales bacterium 16-40-21]OZA03586.1 MAG: glycerol-3-phosphate dehydrogenase [Sulfuricurvum sp. 17-40-25]HQS65900.1 (Fe-S)-binding protein [Sulfuricurvum sp.]HQT36571.1 (Fe-S)-binding protein [Sulfuricurvum sp.]
MSAQPHEIFNYTETSDACIKCGKCIPVCTIHNVNADEVTSPRGFIDLLGAYQRGELELDFNAKDIFESCFLCTNCVDVCPKALPTDMIIEQVRADLADKFGIAWFKRAFFYLLRHRTTMDILFKLGYVFQTCGFKIKAQTQSMEPRFSLPIIKKDRLLPSLGKTSFLNSYPENISNGGKRRVAVFIGCLANYNYTEIGKGLVEILEELEIDVFIPKKQLCCGAPAYFTGDFATVDYNAKKNIEYFESFAADVEAIIIPEATCSAMIKIDYEHFFHDQPQWLERAKKIKEKVFMATEWLEGNTNITEILASKGKSDLVVTYHDPCHARKMQGVYQEPRRLVSQNYKITEMSDPNVCCGFGGVTMQTEKFYLAQAAGKPKAAMIRDTGAQIVTAECSACRMQINNSMFEANVDVIFKNPIELMADALKSK